MVDLEKCRGGRKLKRGNTGVPMYMSLACSLTLYRCCAARVLLKFRGSVGCNCPSLCAGRHAHAHTEGDLEARLPLYHGCHNVKSLRCDKRHTQQQTAYQKQKRENKKLSYTSLPETVPGSYCCRSLQRHTRTHARS